MATVNQHIIWTALPNGVATAADGSVHPALSVFVSFRLTTDIASPQLGHFEDLANWASRAITWDVVFGNGTTHSPATPVSPDPRRPDLWSGMFPDSVPVRNHAFPDYSKRKVRSYPVHHIVDFLRAGYTAVASTAGGDHPPVTALETFRAIGFEDDDMAHGKREQRTRLKDALDALGAVPFVPTGDPPYDFFQLERFHRRSSTRVDVRPPDPDFHQIVTLLANQPSALRLLGLVIDLVLDRTVADILAAAPSATDVRVVPTYAKVAGATDVTPRTRCLLSPTTFAAQPRPGGDIDASGYLEFADAGRFEPVVIDHDGAGIKAMDLGVNLRRSERRPSVATAPTQTLPVLRSAGFSIARLGLAAKYKTDVLEGQKALNNVLLTGASPGVQALLYRDDVTRGFRVDVYDADAASWFSLMRRQGELRFTGSGTVVPVGDHEGWASLATTSALNPAEPDDLYLPETIVQWKGWSLVLTPPGATLDKDDHPVRIDESPTLPGTAVAFEARFSSVPGTLPRLRFGRRYRFRARTVDLAGNGPAFGDPVSTDFSRASAETSYPRFDPVSSPIVLYRNPRTEGETVTRVVLRSQRFDKPASPGSVDRHLAPPKNSQRMAEEHGRFDASSPGGLVLDKGSYAMIAAREPLSYANLGHEDPSDAHPGRSGAGRYFPDAVLPVPYLPDVLARGIQVRNEAGVSVLNPLPDFDPAPGSNWPDYRSLRLSVVEGATVAYGYDPATRVVTVSLPKATEVRVRVSSRFSTDDLASAGLWQWLEQEGLATPALRQQVVSGSHWMFTPFVTLTLVHAVRQPLVAVNPAGLTQTRMPGATFTHLRHLNFLFSRKSTGRLDLMAAWNEHVDGGVGAPDPFTRSVETVAVTAPLTGTGDVGSLSGRHELGDTRYRLVHYDYRATTAFPDCFVDRAQVTLEGTTPHLVDARGLVAGTVTVKSLDGSVTYRADEDRTGDGDYVVVPGPPGAIARTGVSAPGGSPPLLAGTPVAVTYLAPQIDRRSATKKSVQVLSSARPAAPVVEYVLPTFGWSASVHGAERKSQRTGGGLRVYLQRPWWSSGDGELLGVVLWPSPFDPPALPADVEPYVSRWGIDPVHSGPTIPNQISPASLPGAVVVVDNVRLAEAPNRSIKVAGHGVSFDFDRKLWYCDIAIAVGSYWPFVRLGLVRYQPNSLTIPATATSPAIPLHLSRVTVCDFAQVAPNRTVSVTPVGQTSLRKVVVTGPSFTTTAMDPVASEMLVLLEQRDAGVASDVGWSTVATEVLTKQVLHGVVSWEGVLNVPPAPTPGSFRLIVEEHERFRTDGRLLGVAPVPPPESYGRRLVYMDIVPL